MGSVIQEHSEHLLRTSFGTATQIPVQVFMDKILPPLHTEIDFDKLVDLSIQNPGGRSLLPITKNGRLWGYGSKKPSEVNGPRSSTFRSLLICAGRVAKAVKGLEKTLVFKNNDRSHWDIGKRREDSLPDAYLLVTSPDSSRYEDAVNWVNIAIPAVYSKFDTEHTAGDNAVKILRCMSQCMDHDARRRFVYGFAAEDSTMTLWYCNRAQIICSEPFNFVTDSHNLFRFLLSVMFAERHQLGFDPTMTMLTRDDDSVQYDILVRSDTGETQLFRTLELLSEPGADDILGRATRVWKAVKVENGVETGDPVVLKDCWVDHYREREGSINARIRASATSEHEREVLEKSLLTVLSHGDVFVSGIRDRTISPRVDSTSVETAEATVSSDGRHAVTNPSHRHQVHYRIVFKEVGQPLCEATSLRAIFRALRDVVDGLSAMYSCGWIHGDLSAGNILLYGDWAKIADLEYAAQRDERKEHDRTGTEYFTAVEIAAHYYLFFPQPWERTKDAIPNDKTLQTGASSGFVKYSAFAAQTFLKTAATKEAKTKLPVFRYNPLHDLESVWWIALYFIVTREVVEAADDSDESRLACAETQREVASDLFWDGTRREFVFKIPDEFLKILGWLHPSVFDIGISLEAARRLLIDLYIEAERHVDGDLFEVAENLHVLFNEMFSDLVTNLTPNDIVVRPVSHELE